jgi:hypothetical protein
VITLVVIEVPIELLPRALPRLIRNIWVVDGAAPCQSSLLSFFASGGVRFVSPQHVYGLGACGGLAAPGAASPSAVGEGLASVSASGSGHDLVILFVDGWWSDGWYVDQLSLACRLGVYVP